MNYYNENDPKTAAWLRELIKTDQIPKGEVDERSIEDVSPTSLIGYTQHHFFAGIGGWSYALKLSNWPESKPVWTGSCPCQPFSAAGKRSGTTDERHLWPAFHWLIKHYRPECVFGEQVSSKDGIAWLDLVSTDLEGEGYSVAPLVFPACGVGAPHKRERIWFVADAASVQRNGRGASQEISESSKIKRPSRLRHARVVGDSNGEGTGRHSGTILKTQRGRFEKIDLPECGVTCEVEFV